MAYIRRGTKNHPGGCTHDFGIKHNRCIQCGTGLPTIRKEAADALEARVKERLEEKSRMQNQGLKGYSRGDNELTTCDHCGFGHTEYYILKGTNGNGAFKSMKIGETCLRFKIGDIMGVNVGRKVA